MNAYPSLKDRVVLVTGGSRGLGREMALALAEQGARIAITDISDSAPLRKTAGEIEALTGQGGARSFVADVRDFAACKRAVDATHQHFGRIDVLINNAGLGMMPVSNNYIKVRPKFWEISPESWRLIMDTNIHGVFNMARLAVPHMVAQGFGKLINISTSEQTMVRKGFSPYGPSKAALEAMSRVWAQDLEGTGVDVNIYLPGGAADTDIVPSGPDRRGADGNLLPPSIMRPAILWLCADESNGRTGGRYIARFWDDSLPAAEAAAKASMVR
jgi:NAD(P)-dependent dehydrogenase (short-subunit alcohol dehydrogenase family)